jgi:hypothetical protein
LRRAASAAEERLFLQQSSKKQAPIPPDRCSQDQIEEPDNPMAHKVIK